MSSRAACDVFCCARSWPRSDQAAYDECERVLREFCGYFEAVCARHAQLGWRVHVHYVAGELLLSVTVCTDSQRGHLQTGSNVWIQRDRLGEPGYLKGAFQVVVCDAHQYAEQKIARKEQQERARQEQEELESARQEQEQEELEKERARYAARQQELELQSARQLQEDLEKERARQEHVRQSALYLPAVVRAQEERAQDAGALDLPPAVGAQEERAQDAGAQEEQQEARDERVRRENVRRRALMLAEQTFRERCVESVSSRSRRLKLERRTLQQLLKKNSRAQRLYKARATRTYLAGF